MTELETLAAQLDDLRDLVLDQDRLYEAREQWRADRDLRAQQARAAIPLDQLDPNSAEHLKAVQEMSRDRVMELCRARPDVADAFLDAVRPWDKDGIRVDLMDVPAMVRVTCTYPYVEIEEQREGYRLVQPYKMLDDIGAVVDRAQWPRLVAKNPKLKTAVEAGRIKITELSEAESREEMHRRAR